MHEEVLSSRAPKRTAEGVGARRSTAAGAARRVRACGHLLIRTARWPRLGPTAASPCLWHCRRRGTVAAARLVWQVRPPDARR
eukprot:6951302-Prymnesium_polylepis.2